MWVKGGGREAGFGLEAVIGELDHRWRDYILVGEWRTYAPKIKLYGV